MSEFIRHKERSKLNALGWYQVAGGISCIGLAIWMIAMTPVITGLYLSAFLLMAALSSFSIFCGYRLLKGDVMKALRYSTINQVLQIFNIAFSGFLFSYCAGIMMGLTIDLSENVNYFFDFSLPEFHFNINSDRQIFKVGINFVALGLVYFIEVLKKDIEEEWELAALSKATANDIRTEIE